MPEAKQLLIFKLGDPVTGWIPSQAEIDDFMHTVENLSPDDDGICKLVTHPHVSVELVNLDTNVVCTVEPFHLGGGRSLVIEPLEGTQNAV